MLLTDQTFKEYRILHKKKTYIKPEVSYEGRARRVFDYLIIKEDQLLGKLLLK